MSRPVRWSSSSSSQTQWHAEHHRSKKRFYCSFCHMKWKFICGTHTLLRERAYWTFKYLISQGHSPRLHIKLNIEDRRFACTRSAPTTETDQSSGLSNRWVIAWYALTAPSRLCHLGEVRVMGKNVIKKYMPSSEPQAQHNIATLLTFHLEKK